jgi:hypothetical protein
VALAILQTCILGHTIWSIRKKGTNLTNEQRQALFVLFIPSFGYILIIINAVVVLIASMVDFSGRSCAEIYTTVSFAQLFFLAPLNDYIFFIRFVTKLEEVAAIKVQRLRCLFFMSNKPKVRLISPAESERF